MPREAISSSREDSGYIRTTISLPIATKRMMDKAERLAKTLGKRINWSAGATEAFEGICRQVNLEAKRNEQRISEAKRQGGKMTRSFAADIEAIIRTTMATGKYQSEDELLREALERLNDETVSDGEDLQAVREAIVELEQGDEGMELDEAFEEVREAVEKRLKS